MKQADRDEILTILARDARTTPETIATLTGRATDEVRAAIAEYERSGVIKQYKAVIDWEKAGSDRIFAFIDVKVVPAREVGFNGLADRLCRYPEVHSMWLISGSSDLRLVVEAADMREIGRFVSEKLSTIEGITGTDTHFVLRRYKEDQQTFTDPEEDRRLIVSP